MAKTIQGNRKGRGQDTEADAERPILIFNGGMLRIANVLQNKKKLGELLRVIGRNESHVLLYTRMLLYGCSSVNPFALFKDGKLSEAGIYRALEAFEKVGLVEKHGLEPIRKTGGPRRKLWRMVC